MASFTRAYTIPPNGLIDPEALRDELDRIAVAHNANNRVIEGKANLSFNAGFQVSYAASENAFGKYCTLATTANSDDHPTYTVTESDAAFQELALTTDCIAVEGTGNVARAKAFHLAVTFYSGGDAATCDVLHPADAGYVTANGIIIRDSTLAPGTTVDVGQHIFAIADGVTRTIGATTAIYAECIVRNTVLGGTYDTSGTGVIQFRCGTDAGGQDATVPLVSFRLLGYYV